MTKITTDFVGTESTAVTKSRLTSILAYWGASTAGYTTWGQARSALNTRLLNTTAGVIGSEELAGSFLPKINFLNDPDAMITTALFGAGEQGVWFDPSDVANVAWRRNLLLWSEDFSVAFGSGTGWSKVGVVASGSRITANAATGTAYVETSYLDAPAGDRTISVVFPSTAGRHRYVWIGDRGIVPIASATFDLNSVSVVGKETSVTAVAVTLPDGSVKCSITHTRATSGGSSPQFALAGAAYTSDRPSLTWAGGEFLDAKVQFEISATATEYQPITNLNNEIIARFPDATMFQDAAGTTPVYAPNQPVGLRLDKSKGLVRGPELVVNGGGSSTTGWSSNGGGTVTSNGSALVVTASVAYSGAMSQNITFVAGKTYELVAVGRSVSGSGLDIRVDFTVTVPTVTSTSFVTIRHIFTATGTFSQNVKINSISAGGVVEVDNISIKEIPGNHATQSTDISRPLYGIEPAGGRRNLLTYSQDFTNAAWPGYTGWAATSATTVSGAGSTRQAVSGLVVGQTYTLSVDVQKLSGAITGLVFDIGDGTGATILLPTGAVERRSITLVAGASGGFLDIVANNTGSFYISRIQLELGSIATPYQKVVSAYEVTEAGVQTCHYCNYDGTNDWMVTNSINFSTTDKVSVFSAVRNSANVSLSRILVELSASTANIGTFGLQIPRDATGYPYAFESGGSIPYAALALSAAQSVPKYSVVSGQSDISGDLATIRVNGTQVGQSTANQGTGNFGNFPLYIGRRGGIENAFNGRDYGIIITGKLATSTQIGNAENFLLNKLGSLAPVITGVPTIGVS